VKRASSLSRLQITYDLVWRKFLYIIVIDVGIPMKLARLITMCLNENLAESG